MCTAWRLFMCDQRNRHRDLLLLVVLVRLPPQMPPIKKPVSNVPQMNSVLSDLLVKRDGVLIRRCDTR